MYLEALVPNSVWRMKVLNQFAPATVSATA
jgi:hypothetical protein